MTAAIDSAPGITCTIVASSTPSPPGTWLIIAAMFAVIEAVATLRYDASPSAESIWCRQAATKAKFTVPTITCPTANRKIGMSKCHSLILSGLLSTADSTR